MVRVTIHDPFLDRPDLLDILTHLVDVLGSVDRATLAAYLIADPAPQPAVHGVGILDSAALALNVLAIAWDGDQPPRLDETR